MKIWFMKHFLKNCYKKYLNEKEQVNKLKIEIYNNYDSFNKIVKFYDDVFPSRSYPIRHIIFQLNKKTTFTIVFSYDFLPYGSLKFINYKKYNIFYDGKVISKKFKKEVFNLIRELIFNNEEPSMWYSLCDEGEN